MHQNAFYSSPMAGVLEDNAIAKFCKFSLVLFLILRTEIAESRERKKMSSKTKNSNSPPSTDDGIRFDSPPSDVSFA